ncbi:DNA-binding response regulator [Haloferula helveola]|uniref:DNA-binding response regulator n=2 Tax=Haloferula helveola TaxID=490095 RepID=A0ABN6HF16_9BACT|nr:DNA-binding response regulator [Haloferula helveola]
MLVEDNPEYREVIRLALARDEDIGGIREFGTAEIALRSLRDPTSEPQPDVLLLDLRLPGLSGLEALPTFVELLPAAKIIVLTQSDREADVLKAIADGASGYLLKSSTVTQIREGIRTVLDGGASLDPRVASFLLKSLKDRLPKAEPETQLSERELQILTLLGEGLVKKEISDRLGISYPTVDSHVRHIYEKLKVRNAPSAVNVAHRLGIFPTGD